MFYIICHHYTIPCGILVWLAEAIYKVNIYIFIISVILTIFCLIGCYKWIFTETLLHKYETIIVKTKFTSISWKFVFYSFCIEITTSILTGILFDFSQELIGLIAYITVDYCVMNLWLERYSKMEISVNNKQNDSDDKIY